MDYLLVTFGVLMGMEVESRQNSGAGGCGKEALLVFCPTGETEEGTIETTQRMLDLELMGFRPVAITRWNPDDIRYYKIFAKEGLSEMMKSAVLDGTWSLLCEALGVSELLNYSSTDNN